MCDEHRGHACRGHTQIAIQITSGMKPRLYSFAFSGTADCVFPFVYKDFTYHAPTTADTSPSRWWCAINIRPGQHYEEDNWVYTHDSTSTRGSRQCQFPFQYEGVNYYGCTYVDHSSCWCSFSRQFVDGGWGSCNTC